MKVKKVNLAKNFEYAVVVPKCFGGKKYGYALTSISKRDIKKIGLDFPEKANFIATPFLHKLTKDQQPVSIEIPENIIFIEESAFKNSAVERVDMSLSNVQEIGHYCFAQSKIKHLILPDKIKFIPEAMCNDCLELESIKIPESVTAIYRNAFYLCSNLKSVVLGQGLKSIDACAFARTGLEQVDIPASVECIENNAFLDCPNLKKVVLHDGLKYISKSAFEKTGIEEIQIPGSVTYLNLSAFSDCPNLTKIKFEGFNAQLNIVVEKGEYSFDDDTWLALLTYSPKVISVIPKEKFMNEDFVAACKDAVVMGIKARDEHFGLSEQRIFENERSVYEVTSTINHATGKTKEMLEERNQQLLETFKSGTLPSTPRGKQD